ncbi:complement C1q subcomponent subunit A-like [Babylonia areolata]|uniref:complement C1q subcomponent subunit A-like n=1 Tax=Babylonia areolata TaxID=304850 RepID=UPI003FD3554E
MSAKADALLVALMALTVHQTMGAPQAKRSDDVQPVEVVQNMANQVATLEAKVAAVQDNLRQLQETESHKVAFTASILEHDIIASPGHVIPFSRVVTNAGNAYDANTSAFTAPFDGQYMFFVSIDVTPTYKCFNILRNGRVVIPGHNDAGDHHIVAGGVITLRAGDEVTVNHDPAAVGAVDGGHEAIFTGFNI